MTSKDAPNLAADNRSLPCGTLLFMACCAIHAEAGAQANASNQPAPAGVEWQQCSALSQDAAARLACFDQWAKQQGTLPLTASAAAVAVLRSPSAPVQKPAVAPVVITMTAPEAHNCKNPRFTELSRFWELEAGSDCGTFGIRGYNPISLSWVGADSVNKQPTSPAPDHSATSVTNFTNTEMRIALSVRTKIAKGLLTRDLPLMRDSLWFGYSQQSNWQLFSGDLSRPFRTTDHEPELIYILPTDAPLPWGWRLRYGGISINHQSNGQPLPLSRSWNRTILMAGMEKDQQFNIVGKLWYRMPEEASDDDNPDISDLIGRAEVAGFWNINPDNTVGMTLRHALRSDSNGSFRLEWLRKLGESGQTGYHSGLRFHTTLFSGYGNSLIDYNRRRTVLSVGLSLVDW
ncbi:MAG: phospholipase A [Rhodoferax sp.]|nr:phospholipase A [Rhodoferax sp.]